MAILASPYIARTLTPGQVVINFTRRPKDHHKHAFSFSPTSLKVLRKTYESHISPKIW